MEHVATNEDSNSGLGDRSVCVSEPGIDPGQVTSTVQQLHVVIIDEEMPYPPTSGKRIRTLNVTLRLARRHRITYICQRNADPEEARQASIFFAEHGIETIVVDRAVPPKSGLAFYLRLALNLFSSLPYSVASHSNRALHDAIQAYAAVHAVDLWQAEWTPYMNSMPGLAGAAKVVMAHNVESQIWRRYFETERNPLKRWYIKHQWRKFDRFEKWAFRQATKVVAVSHEDARLIRERFGASRVDVVDNGVDTRSFTDAGAPRDAGQILFLGSLDWRPNLDAVAMLLDVVFPAVRAQVPSARLCIVGRNPPESLIRRTRNVAGVELHANVADVRPFLARSGLLAVPLRIGGGSRLKILEALASGLPVVSTRIGAEGLCLEPGRDLVVVDRAEDMVDALVEAVRQPDRVREMARNGRRIVLERYDWDTLADRLERVWMTCNED